MRVSAGDLDIEHFARDHVGRGGATADDRRARPVDTRVGPLCPAQSEFQHRRTRVIGDLGRFGGDQGLVIDQGQKRGLHELGLENGGFDDH